jgi:hypothetical protein
MSTTESAPAHIKGAAFREFLKWYAEQQGPGRLAEHVEALPTSARAEFDAGAPVLGVLASRWYPASTVHRLLDEIARGRSAEELRALATEGARVVMDATLHGIYRVLFSWMANPERYARHAHRLWNVYYDSGVFEVTPQPDGHSAVSIVRGWRAHHPVICELNRGAAIAIYEAMGCSDVECDRTSCVDEGAEECRFVTSWR